MGPRGFVISVTLLFLLVPIQAAGFGNEETSSRNPYTISGNLITGEINIGGDMEFMELMNEMDATGSGTSSDPYLISGYTFDAQGENHCLYIRNTSLHFSIVDCNITGSNAKEFSCGLGLYYVKNYSIERSKFSNNGLIGSNIYYSDGTLRDSTFINNSKEGLKINRENNLVENCTFNENGFGLNSTGKNIVKDCSFNTNRFGLFSVWDRDLICEGCEFVENVNGIQANSFKMISNNLFSKNLENGLYMELWGNQGGNDIDGNTFLDNKENGILMKKYIIQDDYTNITNNTIRGSEIGISSCGMARIENNTIEDSLDRSIAISMGNAILRNNTLKGRGISYSTWSSSIDIDNSTLLNCLPILYLYNEWDRKINTEYSQIFLEYCENISIVDQKCKTEPYSILLSYCEDIKIRNCDTGNLFTTEVEDLLIVENNISGLINGTNSYLTAKRNNFKRWPCWYFNSWEWSTDFDIEMDENYYADYPVNNNSTSDGVHWNQPYSNGLGGPDYWPRIFPIGYEGPREPVFIKDQTPGSVSEGSNLTFFVEVADFHMLKKVQVILTINGEEKIFDLTNTERDFWCRNVTIEYNIKNLSYHFKGVSVTGYSSKTEIQNITVFDRTSPVIIDRSDVIATTGDEFVFEVDVSDNRAVEKVLVNYAFGSGPKEEIILRGDLLYTGSINIPSNSIDPLHYSIIAVDASGNSVNILKRTVTILDDDDPVIFFPDLINTTTGVDTILDAERCTDNIGIVEYKWRFGEEFRSTISRV